jgi:hypothetical protein
VTGVELLALEKRETDLRVEADRQARANQAERRARRRDSLVVIGALALAFMISAAIGAIWFPDHLVVVVCL